MASLPQEQIEAALAAERGVELGHRTLMCQILQELHDNGDGHGVGAFQNCQHKLCLEIMDHLVASAAYVERVVKPALDSFQGEVRAIYGGAAFR